MFAKILRFIQRALWILIVGTMIAFHNMYTQEFKALEDVTQEIVEDEEE